jgi:putative tricarboxylic transport membrane protein
MKMMIPANPGGGWDGTGRELARAMQAAGQVKNVQFDNKGGAGGTIGLAQFVNSSKGDPNATMMTGFVMVGGIVLNKSAVNLTQVTPIARLMSEYEVIVVPASSPYKTLKELVEAFKANRAAFPGAAAAPAAWTMSSAANGGAVGGRRGLQGQLRAVQGWRGGRRRDHRRTREGGHLGLRRVRAAHHVGQDARAGHLLGEARSPGINIPTIKEQGYDVVLANWRGIVGAPGITKAQRDDLIKAVDATVKSKGWQETLKKQEWDDFYLRATRSRFHRGREQAPRHRSSAACHWAR